MGPMLGLVAALAVVVLAAFLNKYATGLASGRFPMLRNKRICLLIAHPDDEAMFFAPTVLALTRPETGNHVKILCLSTGNADGLGETRKKELVKSGLQLGLRNEDDVFIVDNPADFPDSMTKSWDESKISDLLRSAFAPALARQLADGARPSANIDVLVTFDGRGVSSHPNHISLYHGARAFAAALVRGDAGGDGPVDLYTLTTVHLLRKYSSFLDVFATMAVQVTHADREPAKKGRLVFMNQLVGGAGLATACKAMTDAHKSQMVWFRYLYIAFSRYMIINDLKLETVEAPDREE
ncbi:hypothetical protein RJ55_07587 [Drechmeria coniospora]|nr:hypothetical protein RJ55_07587 [Drechmeria coniospora]